MSDDHIQELDPVTGYDTTGHNWNGIKELNTPFPKLVIWALILTFIYSVIAWILLPAWPLGRDYTRGLLGLDQGEMAVAGYRDMTAGRQDWMAPFAGEDFAALQADAGLMTRAMPAAHRLYEDNCAACHGASGQGGPGFPALADDVWLWSGEVEEIALTIRHGINANDDSRYAEMTSFDWMDRPDREALADYVAAMPAGEADPASPAGELFAENCASCHGETGEGGLEVGAPSLTDGFTLYGQDTHTVWETLRDGRLGVMPAWNARLSDAEINLLALYVAGLGDGRDE
ncbi:MAG: cytochrome-c oxidase, cbb3-type subunit III [Tropicimonas sp.]|uniref:cytochrome-c oxidase, cbb3-type subunit III n=1 Tax=Tropicimonas sp. TaxID=2067044 RepID=UPI003A8B016E